MILVYCCISQDILCYQIFANDSTRRKTIFKIKIIITFQVWVLKYYCLNLLRINKNVIVSFWVLKNNIKIQPLSYFFKKKKN